MADPTVAKDSSNSDYRVRKDPTAAFQDCPWYKKLVKKMAALINSMDDKPLHEHSCSSLEESGLGADPQIAP